MDEVQPGCPEPSGVTWRSLCTCCASCWCLLLPLLSVIVGMPFITIRSWSQALVGCFQRDKFSSWSQTSHFQGSRDTGLRGGEVQGDEVHACCSLRGFPKIQLLQAAAFSLRKPGAWPQGLEGRNPSLPALGVGSSREGDSEGRKDRVLHFRGRF